MKTWSFSDFRSFEEGQRLGGKRGSSNRPEDQHLQPDAGRLHHFSTGGEVHGYRRQLEPQEASRSRRNGVRGGSTLPLHGRIRGYLNRQG